MSNISSFSPTELVTVLTVLIFLVIVFWRVAVPLLLAVVLAKVLVSMAAMAQAAPLEPLAALVA